MLWPHTWRAQHPRQEDSPARDPPAAPPSPSGSSGSGRRSRLSRKERGQASAIGISAGEAAALAVGLVERLAAHQAVDDPGQRLEVDRQALGGELVGHLVADRQQVVADLPQAAGARRAVAERGVLQHHGVQAADAGPLGPLPEVEQTAAVEHAVDGQPLASGPRSSRRTAASASQAAPCTGGGGRRRSRRIGSRVAAAEQPHLEAVAGEEGGADGRSPRGRRASARRRSPAPAARPGARTRRRSARAAPSPGRRPPSSDAA